MKKICIVLLVCTIIITMTTATFADSAIITDKSMDMGKTTEYVADKATLDALYQEHLALRVLPADLSAEQADYLLALGVDEDAIDTITNGEVADLLKTGEIVKPEYIMKHINESSLVAEIAESKEATREMLESRGLNDEQIETFFEKRLAPWDYSEDENNAQLINDLAAPLPIHTRSTNCHIFTGSRASSLLGGESTVHFHANSFPSSTYDDYGNLVSLPKNPTEGTTAYTLKCNILADHINDVSLMAMKLYNRTNNTGTAYNYYLWTEESTNSSNKYHEGVDTNRGSGAALRSIIDGTIINKTVGSATSLSKLLVYNSTYDVTVQYLHGNWSTASSGSLGNNVAIGTEDKRGADGYHTHIQIVDGQSTSVPAEDASISTLKPYAYFWVWCK